DLKTSVNGRQSAEPRSFCGTVGRIRVGLPLTKVQALQGHASSPLWSSGLGSTKLLKTATLPATVTNVGRSDRRISGETGILTFLERTRIGMPNPIVYCSPTRVVFDTPCPRVESVIRSPRSNRIVPITILCTAALVIIAALWTSYQGWFGPAAWLSRKQGTPSSGHYAVLTWKASPSVVVGYYVYRSENPGGPYKKLNSSPIRETTYKDPSVQAGHTYLYMVTAVDAKGHESGFSNQVRATVPSP